MRKVLGTVAVVSVEGVGTKVVEMTVLPSLLQPPWIFVVFGGLSLSCLAIWYPEVRAWLDPAERVIRKGEAEARRNKRARLQKHIRLMQKEPMLRQVTYDPSKGVVGAQIDPRTWRGWVMRRTTWLANRRMLPEWAWLRMGKLMGF